MATCFSGVGNTPVEDPRTREADNVSEGEALDEELIRQLLHKTATLNSLQKIKTMNQGKPYMNKNKGLTI